MKNCFSCVVISLLVMSTVRGQTPTPLDPSIGGSTIVQSSELFLLWGEGPDQNSMISHQRIFRYLDSSSLLPTQRLQGSLEETDSAVAGNLQMDVATGNFNGDRYDDVVAAWEAPGQTITMLFPHIEPATLSWTSASRYTVPGPVTPYGGGQRGRMYVKAGKLENGPLDQVLLAYQGADSTIHLEVYDVDGNLNPTLRASINDVYLPPVPTAFARFAVALGDLRGDFRDEVVLAYVDSGAGGVGRWGLTVKVYDLQGSKLVPEAKKTVFVQPPDNVAALNLSLAAGNLDNDIADEIAFAFALNRSGSDDDTYLCLLKPSHDLSSLSFDTSQRASRKLMSNELKPLSLAVGDVNGDFKNEVVFALGGSFYVYEPDALLHPTAALTGGGQFEGAEDDLLTYDFLGVQDVDRKGRSDIVLVKDTYGNGSVQTFSLSVYQVDSTLRTTTTKAYIQAADTAVDNGGGSYRHYAVALGDFNGDRVRIGSPTHSTVSNFIQPVVVLNSPPLHFDVFNGSKYDIGKCFTGNTCNFTASYQKSTTSSVEVETQVNSDWELSNGFGVSGSLGEGATINYETYFLQKFGKSFSKVSSESHTESIGVAVSATEDDEIFATVTDYDIFEYPVYTGEGDSLLGNILTIKPSRSESRWFPGKSWSDKSLPTDHEVGNILSYYDSVEHNPHLAQTIRKSYISDSYVLNAGSSFDWYVTFSDFISSSADTTTTNGVEGELNFLVIVKGHYDYSDVSTHRTTVTNLLSLQVHLDNIDMSFGETGYTVTPYAYWGTDGALVVDYAVRPELAPPGYSPTWWQQRYGTLSDPAFILPWRLDPEKGLGISEEAKRFQTKDISFDKDNPQTGDTVTITAHVRNFSLIPTPLPVEVRFYMGDPDSGGVPIANIHGESVFQTGIIPSRGMDSVEMQWQIPPGLPEYPRIYAVLDPQNSFPEVHLENNKGFSVLGWDPLLTDVVDLPPMVPKQITLYQSYPDPFNPTTTIKFSIPSEQYVTLRIYDILGRQVATLMSGRLRPGLYEENWNASGYASGVYFYRLSARDFVATKKMMLMK